MRIGQFGNNFKTVDSIFFSEFTSLYDFDAIIIDVNSFRSELNAIKQGKEWNYYYKVESSHIDSVELKHLFRRMTDITAFLETNKPQVYFVPYPQIFTTNGQGIFSVTNLLPFKDVVNRIEGEDIEIIEKTKFTDFFKKYKRLFKYSSFLNTPIGDEFVPLMKIKGSTKIISYYINNILYLPHLKSELLTEEVESAFLEDLFKIFENKIEEIVLPEWHSEYFLPKEKSKNENLIQLNQKLEEIKNEIQKEEIEINELQKFKLLFTGTGTPLEKQVEKIFADLGCEVLEKDRDDVKIKWDNQIMVMEVKGVNGSAAEKNARQLEHWVSEKEEQVKGVLVVNGFRELQLGERRQDVFPHQMLKYSESRNHCLISGLQLLGLYFDCVSNPSLKEEKLQSLFDTVGVYKGYESWNEFIEMN